MEYDGINVPLVDGTTGTTGTACRSGTIVPLEGSYQIWYNYYHQYKWYHKCLVPTLLPSTTTIKAVPVLYQCLFDYLHHQASSENDSEQHMSWVDSVGPRA